jgi:putative holliday junction resolvase
VGVALSDPLGITAQPLLVIDRRREQLAARLAALVTEHEVTRVVVGLPLRLDGTEGPAALSVRELVAELEKSITVPFELWDERLTTAQAERIMISGGARRDERKARIDQIAAAIILQSYLDAKSRPS